MIYLDSAATSFQKPPEVMRAVNYALSQCASPGRGIHAAAMRASELVYSCREEAARLFHVPSPEQVIFTVNATHALNIAIGSLVRPGGRVLVSGFEHNAVMRPLYARSPVLTVARTPLFDREKLLDFFIRHIGEAETVVCTHVSNVFGFILPIGEIAELCREHGVPLIIDASQSAGVLPIDFESLGAEFIAMPGHKGLLGPQGTGLLLCRSGGEPLLLGGTGSESESHTMPEGLPDRLEAGTHNVPGIAGLRAGIRYIRRRGVASIARAERIALERLGDGLSAVPGLRVFRNGQNQTGALSVIPAGGDCEGFAEALGRYGVAVRAGLHCAPSAHETAGTLETGTVRFSVSPFTTVREIGEAVRITENISKFYYK